MGADAPARVKFKNVPISALGGFAQIPVVVLRNPKLSPNAKLAWATLCSYAWSDKPVFPSHARMAADIGIGTRSVGLALEELEKSGWLESTTRPGRTNLYCLTVPKEAVKKRTPLKSCVPPPPNSADEVYAPKPDKDSLRRESSRQPSSDETAKAAPVAEDRKTWLSAASDLWREHVGGDLNYGQAGRVLKALYSRHGEGKVIEHLGYYLRSTDPTYASLSRFQQTFGHWTAVKKPNRQSYAEQDEQRRKDVIVRARKAVFGE